ncbi:uncharacterized protein LOC110842515 isoform X2 [Folsomia candida]|uniref:uncharacterized protein LOC110842515 isoform X2 n=1 Tax=Folsomia candida TaxID=158441 RepID=UPI0016050803|nr:uncharacterized protein LOC110842515 isoform X2 [Folsomia candida]
MHPFPVRQVILEFRPFFLITTRLFTRCQHTTPFGSPLAQSSGPCTFYRRKGLIFLNGEKLCDYSTKAKCSSSSLNTCLGDARLLCIDQTRFLYKGFNLLHFGSQASTPLIPEELDQNVYEDIADETLEALYTYFDEILESSPVINNGDVSFSVPRI